jgi:hypothetical protein
VPLAVPRRRAGLFGALLLAVGLALPIAKADAQVCGPPAPSLLIAGGFRLQTDGGELLIAEDASGMPVRRWPLRDLQGRAARGVVALLHAPWRRSVVLVLDGVAESWELSYDPAAQPIYDGLVHDYRMGEGIARSGYLAPRRTPLDRPLCAAQLIEGRPWLIGQQADDAVVLHLDARQRIARVAGARALSARLEPPVDGEGAWLLRFGDEDPRRLDTSRWQLQ